jgi:uncharacterized membrane protein (UPF0127 family)
MFVKNRRIRVHSLRNQTVIADECVEANSFLSRLRGLIGRKNLEAGEGMFFPQCNDIHMWFMSISIDVLFLKREGEHFLVTSTRPALRPWKALPVRDGKASETLELPAGTIQRCGLTEGDRLCIE